MTTPGSEEDLKPLQLKAVLAEYNDLRDEAKRRIDHRTHISYFVITVMVGIFGLYITSENPLVVVLIPVIVAYWLFIITSSYFHHVDITEYIREKIEKEKLPLVIGKFNKEGWINWETYYFTEKKIHSSRFIIYILLMGAVYAICGIILYVNMSQNSSLLYWVLYYAYLIFLFVSAAYFSRKFIEYKKRRSQSYTDQKDKTLKMQMKEKREKTQKAHQKYSSPLVGIIVVLHQGDKVAVFKNHVWKLPEKFARGDHWLKEAVHATLRDYPLNIQEITIESYTLLSGKNYRKNALHHKNAYQYNYIALAKMKKVKVNPGIEMKWVSSSDVDAISGTDVPIYPPHKELLKEYFQKGIKDDFTVPDNPGKRLRSDKKRLKETKKVHAEYGAYFPMPLITVDGILLKFSKTCKFEGIILEKRAKGKREGGKWAFPAGFVNAHETVSEALAYEVHEEVGITLKKDQFILIYDDGTGPYRDPRYFVWTQFIVVYTDEEPHVASKEIEDVKVFSVDEIPWDDMAFDHGDVLKEFVGSLSSYL